MANRGYEPLPDDWDGRGQGTTDHSTNIDARHTMKPVEQSVVARTSVGEQNRRGGMTNVDQPYSDNGSLPPAHKYQTGNPGSGYNTAAYKPLVTPAANTGVND